MTVLHTAATKRWVIERILTDHRNGNSLEWVGVGLQYDYIDAIIACARDERCYFVLGECDNQLPNGECGGHASESEEVPVKGGAL